jgi:hypothetical protein
MKKQGQVRKIRSAKINEYSGTWNLHQCIGQFAQGLGRRKDLTEIREDRQGTAPIALLELLF